MSSGDAPQPSFALASGDLLVDRYRVLRIIGRGGMGEVYEVRDELLHEVVALKTLRADLSRNERYARRFQREIQLARRVTNPHVCRVFEVSVHEFADSGRPPLVFFTMELLAGETLLARIRRLKRLPRKEAYPIAVQMAEGLEAAHRAGIVHTDFKSGNVILVPGPQGDRAVITDFGLARIDPAAADPEETGTMSQEAHVVGTVAFMSPEQMTGGRITPASDIYSFGIVLFQMATGELPFDTRHVIHSAVQRATREGITARALAPEVDSHWDSAINRCLQTDPQRRFASAHDLADWFREEPWRLPNLHWSARDWIRGAILSVLILAMVAGMWFWLRRPYHPRAAALDWYAKGVAALHSMSYEAARRALEQAVIADPNFALAHASLARAYDELDYTDLAKDSILRAVTAAEETRLTSMDAQRLRGLQFLVARDYGRAGRAFQELENEAGAKDKAAAALENGWIAQQQADVAGAAAAYERALRLDPAYAAGKLRLGYIQGRRGQTPEALGTLAEAETLYRAAADYEGVTETLYEQARLLNLRSRPAEAMAVIDKALAMARTLRNTYQEIRLELLSGMAVRNLGQVAKAREIAQQAIDMAAAQKMDNLAASGLVDLGNTYLVEGDTRSAEPIFRRALELARRGKVRRYEARASSQLASLLELRNRPDEAKRLVETVLPFYRQAGYQRELIQGEIVLGGALNQLGDFGRSLAILREALPAAVQLRDSQTEALLRQRIGEALRYQGVWPESLVELERAAALLGRAGGGVRLNCSELYCLLGRMPEAERSLAEAERMPGRSASRWAFEVTLVRAEMAYHGGRPAEARELSRRALSLARGTADRDESKARLTEALALIRSGQREAGQAMAASAIETFERLQLLLDAATARLAAAEALLASGDRKPSLKLALDSLDFFEPRGVWEPLWRAHLVAAQTSAEPGDAQSHMTRARAALKELGQLWTGGAVNIYLQRPDLRLLARALEP